MRSSHHTTSFYCRGQEPTRFTGQSLPGGDSTYTIRVPANTTLNYLSYECDTVYMAGTDLIYSFYKKRFMPDRDLMFTWERAEE